MYNVRGGSVAIPDKPGQQDSQEDGVHDAGNMQTDQRHAQLSNSSAVSSYMEGSSSGDSEDTCCYGAQQASMHLENAFSSPLPSLPARQSFGTDRQPNWLYIPQRTACDNGYARHYQHQLRQQPSALPTMQTSGQQETLQDPTHCVDIVSVSQPDTSSMTMDEQKRFRQK
jgi:hypothetical protein